MLLCLPIWTYYFNSAGWHYHDSFVNLGKPSTYMSFRGGTSLERIKSPTQTNQNRLADISGYSYSNPGNHRDCGNGCPSLFWPTMAALRCWFLFCCSSDWLHYWNCFGPYRYSFWLYTITDDAVELRSGFIFTRTRFNPDCACSGRHCHRLDPF